MGQSFSTLMLYQKADTEWLRMFRTTCGKPFISSQEPFLLPFLPMANPSCHGGGCKFGGFAFLGSLASRDSQWHNSDLWVIRNLVTFKKAFSPWLKNGKDEKALFPFNLLTLEWSFMRIGTSSVLFMVMSPCLQQCLVLSSFSPYLLTEWGNTCKYLWENVMFGTLQQPFCNLEATTFKKIANPLRMSPCKVLDGIIELPRQSCGKLPLNFFYYTTKSPIFKTTSHWLICSINISWVSNLC